MKNLLTPLLILLCAAAAAVAPTQPQTQQTEVQPQQDQMLIEATNKKMHRTLTELARDSSVIHLRLMAEMDKEQRHAEVQQDQARLDLAAKTALSTARLAKGSDESGPQLRQAFTTEVAQATQAFNQRLAEIDAELGPDGVIARHHGAYEDREGQRSYARAIGRLYNLGGIGLLEAGTGIGKSLGYLLPALRWSARNKERTVVSTNTINLQEQLVGKDLPFLANALDDQPVRYALLKGWRNYLCLNRLDQAAGSHATLFPGEHEERLLLEILRHVVRHGWRGRARRELGAEQLQAFENAEACELHVRLRLELDGE